MGIHPSQSQTESELKEELERAPGSRVGAGSWNVQRPGWAGSTLPKGRSFDLSSGSCI